MTNKTAADWIGRENALLDTLLVHTRERVRRTPPNMTLFRSQRGAKYSGALMVVGRAVNGWSNESRLDETSTQRGRDEIIRSSMAKPSGCPLAWVLESRTDDGDYSTSRSAFWRVIEGVCNELGIGDETSWPSHIVWTNLYKLAPAGGGNPSDGLCAAQLEPAAVLLCEEIKAYKPKRILFLTGANWFSDFGAPLGARMSKASRPLEQAGEIQGAKAAISPHPQGKEERPLIEAIAKVLETA